MAALGWGWSSPGRAGRLAGGDGTDRAAGPAALCGLGLLGDIGYDTIYALQDKEDDALVGVKSSALALGPRARLGVAICYVLALVLWAVAIRTVRPEGLALAALAPVALHLFWQAAALRQEDGADALAKFRSNRFAGS